MTLLPSREGRNPEWRKTPFDPAPEAWDFFVSYKSQDADLARKVVEQLTAAGIKVWFAEYQILLARRDEFGECIRHGLQSSARGILFVSDAYLARVEDKATEPNWCREEAAALLRGLGPQSVSIVRLTDQVADQEFAAKIAGCPMVTHREHIQDIVTFVAGQIGRSILVSDSLQRRPAPVGYERECGGVPLYLDLAGWTRNHEAERTSDLPVLSLQRNCDGYTVVANLLVGRDPAPEASKELREASHSRELHGVLMRHAERHLTRVQGTVVGVHLLASQRPVQFALTYWSDLANAWTRKVSVTLPSPREGSPVELVFTFGLQGPFSAFCQHVHLVDRLVESLRWPA